MRSRKNLPVLAPVNALPTTFAPSTAGVLPSELAAQGLSLAQLLAISRAYWRQTLTIALLLTLLTAGLVKLMPKTYTATTTLMVSPEGTDPLGGNQNATTPMYNYMSTEAQLMQSPEALLPVIDRLHLTQDKNYSAGYSGNGSTLRDWVRENLVKGLDIQLGAFGSQLIFINASARSPELAAQIANTLADVYLDEQRRRVTGPATERARRFALELAELKNKVRIAQDQVTAYRQRTGVTDTAERNGSVEQGLLASLEGKLQDAENDRRAAEVKAAAEQTSSTVAGSLAVQNLKALLNTQQTQLAQLRTTYGAAHPKVLELESQIRATQRNLDGESRGVSTTNSADLIAARQLEGKMRAAVEAQRAKVLNVNKLQDEGTKFQLELESAQSVYKRALDGYDQIMFASGAHVANVSVVSSAIPPQKPAKPNKIKLFLLGIIAGIALGVVAPLVYELLFNRRIRCRDDFERDFNLPVLMEFEHLGATGSAA